MVDYAIHNSIVIFMIRTKNFHSFNIIENFAHDTKRELSSADYREIFLCIL